MKLKKGRTSHNVGELYPESNLTYSMIIYLYIKYESNSWIFSKDIERAPFSNVRPYVRIGCTDSGDTICPYPSPNWKLRGRKKK